MCECTAREGPIDFLSCIRMPFQLVSIFVRNECDMEKHFGKFCSIGITEVRQSRAMG